MRSRIWQWTGGAALGLCLGTAAWAQAPGQAPGIQDPNDGVQGRSPLNSRDEVRQTQPPRQGYYEDIPRRHGDNRYWEAGGPGQRPGGHWQGRPDGQGNGWGPGPRYRPGYTTERIPDRYWRVPYRGQDYLFSDGYWYRPRPGGYTVIRPPYGLPVNTLPGYAQHVWRNGGLFFVVADTYYQYQPERQVYVVVDPNQGPPAQPSQNGRGYDVIAYPAAGQGPQQQEQDRYHCHRWAVGQSGFDPATATYAPPASVADNYRRALGTCLSGRGYSVD